MRQCTRTQRTPARSRKKRGEEEKVGRKERKVSKREEEKKRSRGKEKKERRGEEREGRRGREKENTSELREPVTIALYTGSSSCARRS